MTGVCNPYGALRTWQVAFCQDCNLRCAYCSTGFGTRALGRGHMPEEVWRRFIEVALADPAPGARISVELGWGETFLHFDAFLRFIDHLLSTANQKGAEVSTQVATNGTLLDERRMRELALRGVSLSFSIDGPRDTHDRHRTDVAGNGSFDSAIRNWRYYRQLALTSDRKPGCSIQSVYTGETPLEEIVGFWRAEEQPLFSTVIQMPSRYLDPGDRGGLVTRQKRYLQELEIWASQQARSLQVPTFLSDYCGPLELYEAWRSALFDLDGGPCGAGSSVVGVDCSGNLFPCEAFVDLPEWQIGNIFEGFSTEPLNHFQSEREKAIDLCSTCSEQALCERGCFAHGVGESLFGSFQNDCWFGREMARIAAETYEVLAESIN